jgi:hypothetical protein
VHQTSNIKRGVVPEKVIAHVNELISSDYMDLLFTNHCSRPAFVTIDNRIALSDLAISRAAAPPPMPRVRTAEPTSLPWYSERGAFFTLFTSRRPAFALDHCSVCAFDLFRRLFIEVLAENGPSAQVVAVLSA